MRLAPVAASVAVFLIALGGSVALAGTCQPGSLQSYIDLGPAGCTVEDKTVFDFLDFGSSILPDDITVTPLSTPGNPGLTFDLGASAGPGDLLQSLIAFSVEVLSGGLPIELVSLSLTGSDVTPDGANTALLCLGTTDPACPTFDAVIVFDIGIDSELADSFVFGVPVAALSLVSDVVVDGGIAGDASLSSVTLRFQETGIRQPVPQPPLWLPVGGGLFALVMSTRRRRHAERS